MSFKHLRSHYTWFSHLSFFTPFGTVLPPKSPEVRVPCPFKTNKMEKSARVGPNLSEILHFYLIFQDLFKYWKVNPRAHLIDFIAYSCIMFYWPLPYIEYYTGYCISWTCSCKGLTTPCLFIQHDYILFRNPYVPSPFSWQHNSLVLSCAFYSFIKYKDLFFKFICSLIA